MKYIFSIITFLFSFAFLQAQVIFPPDLACATTNPGNGNVLLTWGLPNNTCGPFVSYEVWASNNFGGPYTLLTTITNQTTNTFDHIGANGNTTTWYYYMVSNYNCPGFTAINSDTLDNRDPIAPDLTFVTVNNGLAEINWSGFASPETYAYIIYLNSGGFIPIDTVFGKNITTYTNLNSDAENQSELYTIAAMDSCGNIGPFNNDAHRTIYLSYDLAACASEFSLTWNNYINWSGGVQEYNVYYNINGGPFQQDASLSSGTTDHIFSNFDDGDSVCIYIEAVETGTGTISRSNVICRTASITQSIAFNDLTNATVENNSTVKISWIPDPAADIEEFRILRSRENDQYNTIATIPPAFPLPATMEYDDGSAETDRFSYYYQVQALDSCGSSITSGYARTIYLEGKAIPGFKNDLQWNAFEISGGNVNDYNIYRADNNNWILINNVPASHNIYTDNIESLYASEGVFCYRIEAVGSVTTSNGVQPFRSFSNIACIEQLPVIYVPSAFAPQGKNNFFKPVLLFEDKDSYQMIIYNRWGQQIFRSDQLDDAWDGRYNGELVPQGAYGYFIRVTGINGTIIEEKGTVMVIR